MTKLFRVYSTNKILIKNPRFVNLFNKLFEQKEDAQLFIDWLNEFVPGDTDESQFFIVPEVLYNNDDIVKYIANYKEFKLARSN